jgi:two-component system sensor histidine kinase ResE
MELLDLFLDIAKLDEGVMPVFKKEILLRPLVDRVVEDEISLSQAKNISIEIKIGERNKVFADENLLERILQNLLNNALKFTHRGGKISIVLDAKNGDPVQISVLDNGIGIPPNGMKTLFDRFHQAEARRQGLIQGNGLGLAFCREAVRAMGGEIYVHSELGKGSEFIVDLPRQ